MSNIMKFFVKRVCIYYLFGLILCLMVKGQRLEMILALTAGVLLSIFRFAVLESLFKHLLHGSKKGHVVIVVFVIYLFNLAIIGITIVYAMQYGLFVFLAALCGILSITFVLMICAVLNALGVTNNHYGQKVK